MPYKDPDYVLSIIGYYAPEYVLEYRGNIVLCTPDSKDVEELLEALEVPWRTVKVIGDIP